MGTPAFTVICSTLADARHRAFKAVNAGEQDAASSRLQELRQHHQAGPCTMLLSQGGPRSARRQSPATNIVFWIAMVIVRHVICLSACAFTWRAFASGNRVPAGAVAGQAALLVDVLR